MSNRQRVVRSSLLILSCCLVLASLLAASVHADGPDSTDPTISGDDCTGEYCSLGCCCYQDELGNTRGAFSERQACTIDGPYQSDDFITVSSPFVDCSAICEAGPSYSVSGYVKDQQGRPRPAITVALTRTGTTETDSLGYFSIPQVAPGNYTLSATPLGSSACTGVQAQVEVTRNTVQDLTISCACLPDWDCEAVTECSEEGVQEYACTDLNQCGTDVGMPPLLRICNEQRAGFCSDPADLSHGEECYTDGTVQEVGDCLDISYCIPVGEPGACYCRIPSDSCGDGFCNAAVTECTSCPEDCGNPGQDWATVCQDDCEAQTPSITAVTPIPLDDAVVVSWTIEQPGCVNNVEVERCRGTDADCQTFLVNDLNPRSYTDEGLLPDTQYCYTLTYRFNRPDAIPADSEQVCVITGDAYCMSGLAGQEPFCHEQNIVQCQDDNSLSIIDGGDCSDNNQTCVVQDDGPVCLDQGPCDLCNGIYGVFANPRSQVYYLDELRSCLAIIQQGLCYEDVQPTPTDAFDYCGLVESCYDYASEDACEADTCNMFTAQGGCTWQDVAPELGLGVCLPADPLLQDCSQCDADSRAGACTKDLCTAYGSCYYLEEPSAQGVQGCLDKQDMSCTYYTDQESCEGGSSALVDVTWGDGINEPDQRLSGTNAFLTHSQDTLGLGTCAWLAAEQACVKDANNFIEQGDDCTEEHADGIGSPWNITACYADNDPPHTILDLNPERTYGLADSFNLLYHVEDDTYGADDIFTYFCYPRQLDARNIALGEDTCYPNLDITAFKNQLAHEQLDADEYPVNIYYYSEDLAKNLEPVQAATITLDAKPPTITLSNRTRSYFVAEDVAVTDLEVGVATDEPAYCNISLQSAAATGEVIPGGVYGFGSQFRAEYYKLAPDIYELKVVCRDEFGNTAERTQILYADGDPSIRNPQPQGTLNTSDAVLSIETSEDATDCRYSATAFSYAAMESSFTRYNATLYTKQLHDLDTGLYRFYTACQFADGGITERNPADSIVFAVDTQPPETLVLDADSDLPYDPEQGFAESITLAFSCTDPIILNGNTIHYEFGKDGCTTYYCLTQEPGICRTWHRASGNLPLNFTDANPDTHLALLHYYSVDAGGNKEQEKTLPVGLKSMRKPVVRISIT